MGKTKTAVIGEAPEKTVKSSAELYREKKERQEKAKKEVEDKVHISGLKGGQRVKMMSDEEPIVKETETPQKAEEKKVVDIKVRSKKYKDSKKKIEAGKTYKIDDVIKLLKETSYSKFNGTVELHLVVKKTGTSAQVTLPHSGGKEKKIEVADDKTIKKLQEGKVDFDVLLATADMMPKLVAFARVLGPKGLMPNPKNGTIIKSAKDAEKYSSNTLNLKTEKDAPLIHTAVGKVDQSEKELKDNIEAVLKAVGGNKQIVKAYATTTMGPSIRITVA